MHSIQSPASTRRRRQLDHSPISLSLLHANRCCLVCLCVSSGSCRVFPIHFHSLPCHFPPSPYLCHFGWQRHHVSLFAVFSSLSPLCRCRRCAYPTGIGPKRCVCIFVDFAVFSAASESSDLHSAIHAWHSTRRAFLWMRRHFFLSRCRRQFNSHKSRQRCKILHSHPSVTLYHHLPSRAFLSPFCVCVCVRCPFHRRRVQQCIRVFDVAHSQFVIAGVHSAAARLSSMCASLTLCVQVSSSPHSRVCASSTRRAADGRDIDCCTHLSHQNTRRTPRTHLHSSSPNPLSLPSHALLVYALAYPSKQRPYFVSPLVRPAPPLIRPFSSPRSRPAVLRRCGGVL